jgi:exopolysaccharide production protein ExoQ
MPPAVAATACVALILGLFWLDRAPKVHTSAALWITVIWFWIACSRSLAQWLGWGPLADSADAYANGNPLDRVVFTFLLAAGLIVLVPKRRVVIKILAANGPILLFFCYCLVSIIWSDYPEVALKRWIKAFGNLLVVLIIWSERDRLGAVKRLLTRMAYVLIPLSILFYKYYPNLGRGYGQWDGQLMIIGVTLNKNTLGAVCMCLGLGAMWRVLTSHGTQKKTRTNRALVAQLFVLGMVAWLLWVVNSMTALSCFLMCSVLLIAAHSRVVTRRPALVHLVIVTMLLVSISVLFFGVSPETLQSIGRNPTLTDRTLVWKSVVTLVPNGLLGAGFESFWLGPRLMSMWKKFRWEPNEAHNGYLEIYANLGWLGIALLALVLVTGYRAAFRAWRSKVPTGSLSLAYFLAGLTYNFTEAAFFRLVHPVWLFFLFAIINIPAEMYKSNSVSAQLPEREGVLAAMDVDPVFVGSRLGSFGSHAGGEIGPRATLKTNIDL